MRLNKNDRDSTNEKIRNCESLSKRRLPQKNYLCYCKWYATWRDNQRQKEKWQLRHLKESTEKIGQCKGVSQRRLGRKLGVSHMTICRQLSKMNISCYRREKLCKKLANLLSRSSSCLILDDEVSSKFEAVDSHIYINECLEKRLLPFICEHHLGSNYIFWPDLAGCHYSKQTIAWMDENVKFVPKEINSSNAPQAGKSD